MKDFETEIKSKERFQFGKNWSNFLKNLDQEKIDNSKNCLLELLEMDDLNGLSFLDIGSGSGLSSLAAKNAGSTVVSFDYDLNSVECTRYLKNKFYEDSSDWVVDQGSVLDGDYMKQLGVHDIVYSWGVLHHTGNMMQALENVDLNVKPNGILFIAIYNDQGKTSNIWRKVKKAYVKSPKIIKPIIVTLCYIRLWGPTTIKDLLKLKPFQTWRKRKSERGMSPHYDVIDWVGGYPFEVSTPEKIIEFYRNKNYNLLKLKTCGGGSGCNEFVFKKG